MGKQIVFKREENFHGHNGTEYIGPFNYDNDDDVEKAADVIEVLEKWDCEYEYYHDENNNTWLKTRLYYEPGSIIARIL